MNAATPLFQSTLPVRGATNYYPTTIGSALFQSTLPVRGATWASWSNPQILWDFNPRSPCGERPVHNKEIPLDYDFNPRSPCGERRCLQRYAEERRYFNPRSPCGERQGRGACPGWPQGISIHAPRAGSDPNRYQSGSSDSGISIHAPRAGSDSEDAQNGTVYFEQLS